MRDGRVGTTLRVLLLTLALLPLGGCKALCFLLCRHAPPPSVAKLDRDTPESAVAFFVEALLEERTRDMYESLHPDLVSDLDGVSIEDFNGAYAAYRDDFAADATLLNDADRSDVRWEGRFALVTLTNGAARITLVLENRPAWRVSLEDDMLFAPGTRQSGALDIDSAFAMEGDELVVSTRLELQGVSDPAAVKRVALHHDWLLRSWRDAEGIGFLDQLAEETAEGTE